MNFFLDNACSRFRPSTNPLIIHIETRCCTVLIVEPVSTTDQTSDVVVCKDVYIFVQLYLHVLGL